MRTASISFEKCIIMRLQAAAAAAAAHGVQVLAHVPQSTFATLTYTMLIRYTSKELIPLDSDYPAAVLLSLALTAFSHAQAFGRRGA